ncbi:MAG: hypothetical protein OXG15_06915 [Gammaproteobacteria bacterium]|nr:hypothetical protein [Gammaproteobacteria bacterium]
MKHSKKRRDNRPTIDTGKPKHHGETKPNQESQERKSNRALLRQIGKERHRLMKDLADL